MVIILVCGAGADRYRVSLLHHERVVCGRGTPGVAQPFRFIRKPASADALFSSLRILRFSGTRVSPHETLGARSLRARFAHAAPRQGGASSLGLTVARCVTEGSAVAAGTSRGQDSRTFEKNSKDTVPSRAEGSGVLFCLNKKKRPTGVVTTCRPCSEWTARRCSTI